MKTDNMSQTQTQTIITKSGKILDPQQMHVCRLCDKLLSSSSSLDRHMLTHSGERPFVCKRCHMTFTTNGNMHRHMRTHLHKDSLARQQQEQMQLKQSLLVGGTGGAQAATAASATDQLQPDQLHRRQHQIADSSSHSHIASASSASLPLPGGFYSTATASQQQQLEQHLAQQQQLQHQLALEGPLASLIAGNVNAPTAQQNHHQIPVTALLNQQLIAAALHHHHQQQQQQQQQQPLAASQRIMKHSAIIDSNNNQEVSTTFQHQPHQQSDISASAAQLIQNHQQALVASQMMQAQEHRQLNPKSLMTGATADRHHGADQASFESVKTVMLVAAAAAAAAANQNNNNNNNNNRSTGDYSGSSTDLLMELPCLDQVNAGSVDSDQVSPGHASNRLRAKRRKQVNPLRSSHRLDDSASTSESEPNILSSRTPELASQSSSSSMEEAEHETNNREADLLDTRSPGLVSPAPSSLRMGADQQTNESEPHTLSSRSPDLASPAPSSMSVAEADHHQASESESNLRQGSRSPDLVSPAPSSSIAGADNQTSWTSSTVKLNDGYDEDEDNSQSECHQSDGEIVEDISQSYVKTANPNATRKGGKRNRHCYKCKLCTYSSVDRCTLVRHLRIHSGERPYICGICRYAFTTKANCERHVRKRHKKQYNSLGGSGGVKGSNGGGRSLIITDHSNHQTIPVKVNPVAAQTISQTLLRIQEKEQQMQQQQQQQQQQPRVVDNVVRQDNHDVARENDNIERINGRSFCATTNTTNGNNRCPSGGTGKRKHRAADTQDQPQVVDNELRAYQRRRLANKLHKSAASDQRPGLPVGFGSTGPLLAKDLFAARDTNPMANANNHAKQPNDFLLDPATIQAANSFMGATTSEPRANNGSDLAGSNQTSELFVNLLSRIQQMTNNNNNQRDVANNNLATQLGTFSMQQQQSSSAPSSAPICGEHNTATSVSDATFLANMLAAGKAMTSDTTNQQPAALTEQLNSLLSSKHLSQQLRNLNLQNPFFNRRNPFDPFNSLDFAQALDLSCKLQTHK